MEVAGPLGTPLGLAQRKRASPRGHDSTLGESSREAQSGRRLLGTNGVSLWLWSVLGSVGLGVSSTTS